MASQLSLDAFIDSALPARARAEMLHDAQDSNITLGAIQSPKLIEKRFGWDRFQRAVELRERDGQMYGLALGDDPYHTATGGVAGASSSAAKQRPVSAAEKSRARAVTSVMPNKFRPQSSSAMLQASPTRGPKKPFNEGDAPLQDEHQNRPSAAAAAPAVVIPKAFKPNAIVPVKEFIQELKSLSTVLTAAPTVSLADNDDEARLQQQTELQMPNSSTAALSTDNINQLDGRHAMSGGANNVVAMGKKERPKSPFRIAKHRHSHHGNDTESSGQGARSNNALSPSNQRNAAAKKPVSKEHEMMLAMLNAGESESDSDSDDLGNIFTTNKDCRDDTGAALAVTGLNRLGSNVGKAPSHGQRRAQQDSHPHSNSNNAAANGSGGGGASETEEVAEEFFPDVYIWKNYRGLMYHDPSVQRTWDFINDNRNSDQNRTNRSSRIDSILFGNKSDVRQVGRNLNYYRPWSASVDDANRGVMLLPQHQRGVSASSSSSKLRKPSVGRLSFASAVSKQQLDRPSTSEATFGKRGSLGEGSLGATSAAEAAAAAVAAGRGGGIEASRSQLLIQVVKAKHKHRDDSELHLPRI